VAIRWWSRFLPVRSMRECRIGHAAIPGQSMLGCRIG